MGKIQLKFQKWDMIIVAATLLLAVLIFVLFLPKQGSTAAYAEIYRDGELVKTVSLSVDQEFSITGRYENTVTVKDGKIAVTASNCPGKDCVHCGWAEHNGRSIVCLPNALEIRIVAGSGDVDIAVG